MKPFITFLLALAATATQGAALREAQFTRVINEVKKLPDRAPPQTAAVGDKISGKTAVSTGAKSRAELKFGDGTLTRMGANSIFSLDQSARTIDLQQGTVLLQVPKQMGGARIRTAAVTAVVTGTTILVEYEPHGFIKVIVLEGSLDLFINTKPREFRTLGAGDMIIMKPDDAFIPEPVQVELERLKRTSKLISDQAFAPLSNQTHLQAAAREQQERLRTGELLKTSYVIHGIGDQVNRSQERRFQFDPLGSAHRPVEVNGAVVLVKGPTSPATPTPGFTPTRPAPGSTGAGAGGVGGAGGRGGGK